MTCSESVDVSPRPLLADPREHIRSFALGRGRLTLAQERALGELWQGFGLSPASGEVLALEQLFEPARPCVLEIGFGNGESLLALAQAFPQLGFIGVDIHKPGVGHLLLQAASLELTNLRVVWGDALVLLRNHVASASLAAILIFFPDPWPKKRHHKRRLLQPTVAALLADRLQPGGRLELATDCEDYAEQMLAVLDAENGLENCSGPGAFAPGPRHRRPSRFERRGLRLGHPVWDLCYRRRTDVQTPAGAGRDPGEAHLALLE